MRPITKEWLDKAEGDFHSAGRELRARTHPNYDAACFHAQQCAEKYLKARLAEAGRSFPKIHDLSVLLDMILPELPLWKDMRLDVDLLSDYAVDFRYPGESATRHQAREAFSACRRIRQRVRRSLRLRDAC